jgi:hypothetical protein
MLKQRSSFKLRESVPGSCASVDRMANAAMYVGSGMSNI